MLKKINEGLREHDLENLVMPLVSIDEYESKIGNDDDVIVVGFFVSYEEPANDLSQFMDRSVMELLDTDVSPSPNEAGYYMVFIETERNKDFPERLMGIIKEVNLLADNKKWQFKTYHDDTIYELTEENIRNNVRLSKDVDEESLNEFFQHSLIDSIVLDNNNLKLSTHGKTYNFIVETMMKEEPEYEVSPDLHDIARSNKYSKIIGESHNCFLTKGNRLVISNPTHNKYLILTGV